MFRQLPIKKPVVSPFKINSPSKVGGVMKASFDLQHIAKVSDQLQSLYDEFSKKLAESHDITKEGLVELIKSFKSEAIKLLDVQSTKLVDEFKNQFNSVISRAEQKILEVEQAKQIQKGDKGDPGEVGPMPIAGIHFPFPKDGKDGIDGKDGVSPSVEDIVKAIKENKKLKIEHIDGLDRELLNLRNSVSSSIQLAGRHYGKDTWVRGGGDTVKAGSNITITKDVNGVSTIASSGGGFTTLAATETPDGNILVFTFATATAQPSFLIIDGVWSEATNPDASVNWTWDAGLKQATLAIPPNKSIKGIV